MKMTAWTPYKKPKKKTEDVRAVQVKQHVTTCSTTCKQNVTRPELFGKLRSNNIVFSCLLNAGSISEEVTSAGSVPHMGRGHGKGAVTGGGQTCQGDHECGRQ